MNKYDKLNDLRVNRILHTRDGSLTGNALIIGVNLGLGRGVNTYRLITDYGHKLTADETQVRRQFNIGPLADRTHKHYVEQKALPLSWHKLVDFIEAETHTSRLSTDEARSMVQQALNEYRNQQVTAPPQPAPKPQVVWNQGHQVAPQPRLTGNPKDYLL